MTELDQALIGALAALSLIVALQEWRIARLEDDMNE